MGKTLLLNNEDVAQLLDVESCVSALEDSYRNLGQGDAVNRPKTYIVVPREQGVSYSYCTMEGADRGLGVVAIRMKSDMNQYVEAYGMKRHDKWASTPGKFCGLVMLFSAENGQLLAILNDGVIQHLRVGATSGLAAKYLARSDAATLGMVGSGGQARSHARAFAAVRALNKIKVYSPNPEHRKAYAEEMSRELGVEALPVDTARSAVEGSDIVASCTNSLEPTIRGEWLSPGSHATKVGHHELGEDFFKHVDLVIKHQELFTHRYVTGAEDEKRKAPKALREIRTDIPEDVPTLSKLILGEAAGRTAAQQITFFNNNEGNGLQFACCGALAYRRALERGIGRELSSDWFLQDIRD